MTTDHFLSAQQRKLIRNLAAAIESFRRLDPEMQAQQMLGLLYSALEGNEQLSVKALAERLDLAQSSTSRVVAYWGPINRHGQPGHDMLVAREDVQMRNRKLISTTRKGQTFVHTLATQVGA